MEAADILGLAARLLQRAGKPAPVQIDRLAGGRNNRVYRVGLDGGAQAVLKLYHADPRDPRDRLGAEWGFLQYVWRRGVRNVPEPLAHDPAHHAGLYGFVAGRRLAPEEIDAGVVTQAADFIIAVNAAPRTEELAPGSEACFSVADHLAMVARRVARLAALDEEAPLAAEAATLVATRLSPLWDAVKGRIDESGIARDAPIATACVSPSDFGFHNALSDPAGRISFLDFEYAGRDDPAKLVCDFFCQPEVPVPLDYFEAFLAAIAGPLALSEDDLSRCRALMPAYRIKWVCIILNEFLAVGARRRAFADDGDRASRARRQIERAERYLALVSL
jgi:hypothetical protein